MPELPYAKRMDIVQRYFGGLSYDDIAERTRVAKGTVVNVIQELKAGSFPQAQGLAEQAEALRQVGVDLQRSGLGLSQASAGLSAFQRLAKLGVEPGSIDRFVAMCQGLASQIETPPEDFLRAAMEVHQLRQDTGLDYPALQAQVHEMREQHRRLKEDVRKLKPLRQQAHGLQADIQKLAAEGTSLQRENAALLKQRDALRQEVAQREAREGELSRRVLDLEERAQAADERLAVARNGLEGLSALGLSPEELAGVAQRLAAVAQRHQVAPAKLRDWLTSELEQLDQGMSLRKKVERQKKELQEIETQVTQRRREEATLRTAVAQLRQERGQAEGSLAVLREQACSEVRKAGEKAASLVRHSGDTVAQQMNAFVHQAVECAAGLAQLDAALRSHEWVRGMKRLLEYDLGLEPECLRTLAESTLKALLHQKRHRSDALAGIWAHQLEALLRGLEAGQP